MPKLTLAVSHQLGRDESVRRLKERFSQIKQEYAGRFSDLVEEWDGDNLSFSLSTYGMKLRGRVRPDAAEVKVDVELPLAAMMFKGAIERQMRDEMTRILS